MFKPPSSQKKNLSCSSLTGKIFLIYLFLTNTFTTMALDGVTFASLNCNSLNMSHSTIQNQLIKTESISGMKRDVIFLSDLRLGNRNLTTSKGDISNLFLINNNRSYRLHSNSSLHKRGVGILVASDLDFVIDESELDPGENYILLRASLNGSVFIIGSIYGPNEHNPEFFQSLYRAIIRLGNHPILIGGDFNCTVSADPVDNNPDCFNMASLPNYRHTVYLNEFCEALNLVDPFRLLHPTLKKYSYKPYGNMRKNRSRIDFFLISTNLANDNIDCNIADHTLGTCFDHWPVFLTFPNPHIPNRGVKKLQISNSILQDPDIDIVVWYSVFETYLHYIRVDNTLIPDRSDTLIICGNVRKLLKDSGLCLSYYVDGVTDQIINLRRDNLTQIREIINRYPIDLCYNFELTIQPGLFLEVLLNNFRNDLTSYQSFIFKFKKAAMQKLSESLNNEIASGNLDRADEVELKLEQLNEQIIRDKLDNSNLFDALNNEKMTPFFLKLAKIKKKPVHCKTYAMTTVSHLLIITYGKIIFMTNFLMYGTVHPPVSIDDINNFLGRNIADSNIVINKKITGPFKE
jgi:exonuclease III